MIPRRIQPLLWLASCLCLLDLAEAGTRPTSLTVFGDSLSDIGNLSQVTGGFFPGSDYFDGRYSNGLLYAEQLGFELSHSFAGGSDYAVANARTGDPLIGLPTQLGWFSDANPDGADPEGLYLIWLGGNDVIDGYENPDADAAALAIAAALDVLRDGLSDLLEMGATRVIVLNLPDLSQAPAVLELEDEDTSARAHALTVQWNTGLDQIVADAAHPGVVLFDVFAWFNEVIADPEAAGFTDVQSRALDAEGDDDEFLFWDGVHPTTAAHRKLAERMLAGLSALDPGEPVAISSIHHDLATGVVRFEFESQPGECYVIQASSALAHGWKTIRSEVAVEGDSSTFSEQTDARRRFYRVFLSGATTDGSPN